MCIPGPEMLRNHTCVLSVLGHSEDSAAAGPDFHFHFQTLSMVNCDSTKVTFATDRKTKKRELSACSVHAPSSRTRKSGGGSAAY